MPNNLNALREEIAALVALEAKATPGPWAAEEGGEQGDSVSITCEGSYVATVLGAEEFPCIDEERIESFDTEVVATAELLCGLRNSEPRLLPILLAALDCVEALREARGSVCVLANDASRAWRGEYAQELVLIDAALAKFDALTEEKR